MISLKVDMIYGDTKSTKTSRLGDAAEYYFEKTGKPAQGIFSDPGGYDSIAYLKDQKKLIPFVFSGPARGDRLLEDMDKLSRGWWPKDPENPESPLEYGKLDNVSVRLYDGATTWCRMMFTYFQSAIKYIPQSDSILATTVRSPDMPKDSFMKSGDSYIRRFTGKADYGGVQQRIEEFIRNSAMLPVRGIWTALETKGADDKKIPVFGPDFLGQALTGVCGPWFGNMLHLDFISAEKEEVVAGKKIKILESQPFLFTRAHVDPDDPSKVPYSAGSRVDKRIWQKVPSVMAPDLKAFYQLLDKLSEEAKGLASPLVQGGKA